MTEPGPRAPQMPAVLPQVLETLLVEFAVQVPYENEWAFATWYGERRMLQFFVLWLGIKCTGLWENACVLSSLAHALSLTLTSVSTRSTIFADIGDQRVAYCPPCTKILIPRDGDVFILLVK